MRLRRCSQRSSWCDQESLLGSELFAIDGCKMPSDASKEWSGAMKELFQKRKKIRSQLKLTIKEHQALDRRRKGEAERSERIEQAINNRGQATV